jgi:hypothetical protein
VLAFDDPRHRMVTLKNATDAGLVMIARSVIIKALTLLSIRYCISHINPKLVTRLCVNFLEFLL